MEGFGEGDGLPVGEESIQRTRIRACVKELPRGKRRHVQLSVTCARRPYKRSLCQHFASVHKIHQQVVVAKGLLEDQAGTRYKADLVVGEHELSSSSVCSKGVQEC